jgi:hypothetical protein
MELELIGSRCLCLWRDQEIVSKHELLEESLGHVILRELVEHGSKNRGALLVRDFESRVEVVGLRVSLVDSVENYLLDAFVTGPGFSSIDVEAAVSSEERVEDTCLVFLDEFVVGRKSFVAWHI